MAFEYDTSLPTDKDKVRFLVQDTVDSKHKFEDEEILWVLSTEANVYTAAAQLCDTLVTKAGGVKFKKIGDLSIGYDPHFYRTLGMQLRARGSTNQMPYAGGLTIGDKLLQQTDSDATQPSFVRQLDDNPAAPSPQIPPSNPLTTV